MNQCARWIVVLGCVFATPAFGQFKLLERKAAVQVPASAKALPANPVLPSPASLPPTGAIAPSAGHPPIGVPTTELPVPTQPPVRRRPPTPVAMPAPTPKSSTHSLDQAITYMLRAADLLDKSGMKEDAASLRIKANSIRDEERLAKLTAEVRKLTAEILKIQQRLGRTGDPLDKRAKPSDKIPLAFAVRVLELKEGEKGDKWIRDQVNAIKNEGKQKTTFSRPHPSIWTALAKASELKELLAEWKENKNIKVLAEPTLVTMSGRPASFFSGGEIPIVVPQADNKVTVEYRQVGVRLDIAPTLLPSGAIRMEFRPRVTRQIPGKGVKIGDVKVPALRAAHIDLSANVPEGMALFVGGLKFEDTTLVIAVVPTQVKRPQLRQAIRQR